MGRVRKQVAWAGSHLVLTEHPARRPWHGGRVSVGLSPAFVLPAGSMCGNGLRQSARALSVGLLRRGGRRRRLLVGRYCCRFGCYHRAMESTRQLTAIIEREGDAFVALCPELDIASQGQTVETARTNLIEALELFFESADQTEVACTAKCS